jgi:hypothetical protein
MKTTNPNPKPLSITEAAYLATKQREAEFQSRHAAAVKAAKQQSRKAARQRSK